MGRLHLEVVRRAITNAPILHAFQNSLIVATATMVISTALGTIGAWML